MSEYTGHCHCGQVQYTATLTKEQQGHVLCHCNTCKELSGGAYTLNNIIPLKALNFTKGGDNLGKYTYKADSGNNTHCYYCKNCTSHVYHHQEVLGPDMIVIRTGLLDKRTEFAPAAEIYGKDRFDWQKEVAHTFEQAPPS